MPGSVDAMAHVSPTWQPPSPDEPSAGTLDAAERDDLPYSAYDVDMTEQSWHDLMH